METEFPRCSLPELYALVENFNKESKKSNQLRTHGISPSEAQEILSQNWNAKSSTSRTDLKEDAQPVFPCEMVRKDEERPESMIDLLHRSLLTGSLYPADRLSKSQQRLAQHGIPPPVHTFPYDVLIDKSDSPAITKKMTQSPTKLSGHSIFHVNTEKFTLEDTTSEYLLVEPGNQTDKAMWEKEWKPS